MPLVCQHLTGLKGATHAAGFKAANESNQSCFDHPTGLSRKMSPLPSDPSVPKTQTQQPQTECYRTNKELLSSTQATSSPHWPCFSGVSYGFSHFLTWKLQGHWRRDSAVTRRQPKLQGEVGTQILLLQSHRQRMKVRERLPASVGCA